jgi:imidazolonepropionase-like amidohydrolase
VLARAGVKFAFATGTSSNVRQLPYQAAISVAWGLPREEALQALTIRAAEILGVADRLGSIEPGKAGNLIVTAGDPLEVRTEVKHVIIDGYSVDLGNRHHALHRRPYRDRRGRADSRRGPHRPEWIHRSRRGIG